MGAPELSSLLWKERELLDRLTFKLETEQLLLTSGKTRWIQHSSQEIELLLESLRVTGLARAVEVSATAQDWGVEEESSLKDLIIHAPIGPWAEIFTGHLTALDKLVGGIRELRDANEQFLRAAARSTQETMAGMNRGAGTYDARGRSAAAPALPRLFDAKL